MFKCFKCEFTTDREAYLSLHFTSVHDKVTSSKHRKWSNKHKCDLCDFATSSKRSLKQHTNSVHFNKKEFDCPKCTYSASQNVHLSLHIKSVHEKKKDFKCEKCNYATSDKANLSRHIRTVHEGKKDFKCSQCQYVASQKGYLSLHVKSVHMKQKDLKCLKCDYSASIKSNLVRHYARHHEPKEDNHEEYVNLPIDTDYAVKAEPIETGSWDTSISDETNVMESNGFVDDDGGVGIKNETLDLVGSDWEAVGGDSITIKEEPFEIDARESSELRQDALYPNDENS